MMMKMMMPLHTRRMHGVRLVSQWLYISYADWCTLSDAVPGSPLQGGFLPEAMRTVFSKARFPCVSSLSMAPVIRNFVERYIQCNPG